MSGGERGWRRSEPEVILFDLGGVLIDFAGFEEIADLLRGHATTDGIRTRWLMSASVRDFELGRTAPRVFADRFLSEWDLGLSAEEFLTAFASWPRGLYPGARSLLGALRGRFRLACLSNSNELHWDSFRVWLEPYLDKSYVSFELGLAKPDPAIFHAVLADLAVHPSAVLFLDDAEKNIEAAVELGFQAELVRGPDELERRLIEHKLLDG